MVDKSNEYGYVPSSPTQARGSNTGIFEVNDVTDLLAAGQWSGDFGKLELIETQTVSSVSQVDFTSIAESTYNVHFATLNNISANSSGYPDASQVKLRVSDDGGSTYESGASDYQYAFQFVKTDGTHGERRDSANTDMLLTGRATNTNEVVNAYVYLYNLGDSGKYSFATHHQSIASDEETMFGSQVYTTASTINAIRFFISGFTMSGDISLYGIAES